jgi:hypothetical protein
MPELQVALTVEEREFLAGLLEIVLKDTLVEEHRTRKPTYREHVVHQESLITGLLSKLGKRGRSDVHAELRH